MEIITVFGYRVKGLGVFAESRVLSALHSSTVLKGAVQCRGSHIFRHSHLRSLWF